MARDSWKLDVFRQAHALALLTYRATSRMPAEERYGLQSQLRRAAVSVPANLAEGCARRSTREYARFIDVSLGSAAELRYLLTLSSDLGMLDAEHGPPCQATVEHVLRALHKLQVGVDGLVDAQE